jgi:hypothetical protein
MMLKRQVSTQWDRVRAFLGNIAENGRSEGGLQAILGVGGMNPWLLKMLQEHGCRETAVNQRTERSKQKTDRRDPGLWNTTGSR